MDFLKGLKVVDLTSAIAGAYGTMLLGDLGAEVIKIEPPSGEHYRYIWEGAQFIANNRNKRSVALDLKSSEGQEIVRKMIKTADIFAENFVPGTVDKFGLNYEKVAQLNPRIIYCSMSGFGQSGPYSQRPGYDPMAQAMAGIMIATGEAQGKPVRQITSMIDMTTAMYAVIAILACLNTRQVTGRGQRIETSLLDSGITAMAHYLTYHSFTGYLPLRTGSGVGAQAPYQAFDTRDTPIWIGVTIDKFWVGFCKALNLTDLAADPRYATIEGRNKNRVKLINKVSEAIKQMGSKEIEEKLVAAGVPCGRLLNVGEVSDDPQVRYRGLIEDGDYPGIGHIKTVKTPIMIDGKMPETRRRAPLLGEHTVEVLKEYGYGDSQIDELIKNGVAIQYSAAKKPQGGH
jgi:crotonobetainyl-CoA:carnitine CoA-transferase CaiB-like acyl-CoA transferase